VIPDDVVRLPAGWYPDPTGLPQLRWWDNHAWTQHTIAARQPLIVQEQPLAWAEDLPTRRERREREREDRGTDDLTPPTAQSLLELAPPSADEEPADEPAPAEEPDLPASDIDRAGADRANADRADAEEFDDSADDSASYVPVSASGHAGRIPSVPPLDTAGEAAFSQASSGPRASSASQPSTAPQPSFTTQAPPSQANPPTVGTPLFDQVSAGIADAPATRQSEPRQAGNNGLSSTPTSTAPVWIMALLPLLQLVIVLLLVTGLGSSASTELLMPSILVAIYLATIALAFGDYRLLRGSGIAHPAHWAWSLLTAPVYLFVRAMVLTRTTGRGFGPVLVWFALALLSVASVLAVPGMLITSIPAAFSAQAEQSVTADAAANGATLEVSCPAAPPILVGQAFSCTGKTTTGKSYEIEVSLQRINGWINWRVDDWGINTLSR
jgi:hypothetical protein